MDTIGIDFSGFAGLSVRDQGCVAGCMGLPGFLAESSRVAVCLLKLRFVLVDALSRTLFSSITIYFGRIFLCL